MAKKKTHHMLNYELRWKNFRCFKDTGWLEIRPITILLGPNNAGKSSFIDPLLLLKQTWTSGDANTPLVTRGDILDLGNYNSLIYSHDSNLDLFFGFRFHTHDRRDNLKPIGTYPPGVIELTFCSDESPFGCGLKKYRVLDVYKRPFVSRSLLKSGKYSLAGGLFKDMQKNERNVIKSSVPINFLFTINDVVDAVRESKGPDVGSIEKFSDDLTLYLSVINKTYIDFTNILVNLSYIGPLRARPKRFYERGGEIYQSVGIRGQHTADLLYNNYDQIADKLNYWVEKFGIGKRLRCESLTSNLFQIVVESGESNFKTNFADTGFGGSQLLPLIVQTLIAKENTITIAEQPEIHLNPRLQTILADLFVEMATTSHSVIVETHSEHLLLRLRVLVAEGKISADDIAVYFISREDSESQIRRVNLEQDGHINHDEWPSGFFGDTLKESLALAHAQSNYRE